jgi:hypothetical protein
MEDDNQDPDMVAQALNEVLAVVAPSNMAISYSVYTLPCYDDDDEELTAYKVFSLIKCVDPESISSQLRAHLEMVLKERSCTARLAPEILAKYLGKSSTS